jgi:hypothetical protein
MNETYGAKLGVADHIQTWWFKDYILATNMQMIK